jgi:ribonuclease HI
MEYVQLVGKGLPYVSFEYLLQFDGASEPNPGQSSGGAVLWKSKKKVCEVGKYMEMATNNEAEYTGLIIGLEVAQELGIKHLCIEGDSKLIIYQVLGHWKVKAPGLVVYHRRVLDLLKKFENVYIRHVYREQNRHADSITKDCIIKGDSYRIDYDK